MFICVLQEGKAHDGSKPAQCKYLKDEKIFTTGFSRMSERQYALWNAVCCLSPFFSFLSLKKCFLIRNGSDYF